MPSYRGIEYALRIGLFRTKLSSVPVVRNFPQGLACVGVRAFMLL